jgi:hypothetical protein
MVWLFPTVHRFLIFLSAFQQEYVDCALVRDIAVLFKPLPYAMADIGRGDVQRIQIDDFWSLRDIPKISEMRVSR